MNYFLIIIFTHAVSYSMIDKTYKHDPALADQVAPFLKNAIKQSKTLKETPKDPSIPSLKWLALIQIHELIKTNPEIVNTFPKEIHDALTEMKDTIEKNRFLLSIKTYEYQIKKKGDCLTSFNKQNSRIAYSDGKPKQIFIEEISTSNTLPIPGFYKAPCYFRWNPEGTRLAFKANDVEIFIWDTTTKKLVTYKNHTKFVIDLEWNKTGRFIASASHDNKAIIFDTKTDKPKFILEKHTNSLVQACWSPDDTLLATGSCDHTIILWDTSNGNPLRILNHEDEISSIAFDTSGEFLASKGRSQRIITWNIGSKKNSDFKDLSSKDIDKKVMDTRNHCLETGLAFNHSSRFIVAFNSLIHKKADGLCDYADFFDTKTLKVVHRIFMPFTWLIRNTTWEMNDTMVIHDEFTHIILKTPRATLGEINKLTDTQLLILDFPPCMHKNSKIPESISALWKNEYSILLSAENLKVPQE